MKSVGSFGDFYQAVHGYRPYEWQDRLAKTVEEGGWPGAISAPTGAGKTCVIDVAVWHLARSVAQKPRRAPTRIVFAVNRRVVVDQAFARAQKISKALAEGGQDILDNVGSALRGLSGTHEDEALHVEELRGGLPREDDWARTPAQPSVLCTTVDQLGSRLLFRGYGISSGMAPIHAGLLGEDALILLDEAHLSDAFSETLRGVGRWRDERESALGLPWAVCRLTATPRQDEPVFGLTEAERTEPQIARRLRAKKPAALLEVKSDEEDTIVAAFVEAANQAACDVASEDPVIGIVVNRVGLARSVLDRLTEQSGDTTIDAILLTGRTRPVERDRLIAEYEPSLSGHRPSGAGPLFVVATQCIEAGADFDFDGLVTEIAPLDSLVQRFGRLARSGNRNDRPAPALILATKVDIAARTDDPVYGKQMKLTWDWLKGISAQEKRGKATIDVVDFGLNALGPIIASDSSAVGCMSAAKPAPFLRQVDAEFLSMTSPRPSPDPAIELFIHGEPQIARDISVVWRADLELRDIEDEERGAAIVLALRPLPGEALQVPIWAARRWLARQSSSDLADIDGREPEHKDKGSPARKVLLYRGRDAEVVNGKELRPGDTIVVPAAYGGCDRFGWNPNSDAAVADVADLAALPFSRKWLRIRLHRALWSALRAKQPDVPAYSDLMPAISAYSQSHTVARAIVSAIGPEHMGSSSILIRLLNALADRKISALPLRPYATNDVDEDEEAAGLILVAGPQTLQTSEDDASSFTRPETLASHRESVAVHAGAYSRRIGLKQGLSKTIEEAGRLHDDGKADMRFQAWLRAIAGNDFARGEPLAKSGVVGTLDKAVRRASGLPNQWRHEVLSVDLALERVESLGDECDPELLIWLVGTHHGQGRPFFIHEDPWDHLQRDVFGISLPGQPGPHRLDFEWRGLDWPSLFHRLRRRYGIWGLAYLEAVMRLADHRASEAAVFSPSEGAQT